MQRLPAVVLGMEALVVLLVIPAVARQNDHAALGASLAATLAVCLIIAAALARRPGGLVIGWALQIPLVATGLLAWPMWILGAMFAGLWGVAVQSSRAA